MKEEGKSTYIDLIFLKLSLWSAQLETREINGRKAPSVLAGQRAAFYPHSGLVTGALCDLQPSLSLPVST